MVNRKDITGKIPPQAIEVEMAVLGALMLEPDAIHKVTGIIDSCCFYADGHQKIFSVVKSLADANHPIDLITVTSKLRQTGEMPLVGGPLYLTELTSRVASAAHIEYHARIICQKFIQRELIRLGSETASEAYDDGADIETCVNNLRQRINAIENYAAGSNSGQIQKVVLREAINEMEKDCIESKNGKQPGITTGFSKLDRAIGGWRNTNFIIIASRPGVGKTSIGLHCAREAALSGKWVNFYGLEMKSTDLMRTMIAGESMINRTGARDGLLNDRDWNAINKSIPLLEKLPIIWNDFAGITASHIYSNTVKNRRTGKCDLVIVDYLQLLTPTDKKLIREQQIAEISRTLKKLALSENIPVIAMAQLNREAENVRPQLNHLRESGSLEQDADVVIIPWIDQERYTLSIVKNRRGKQGTFKVFVNEDMTRFGDLPNSTDLPF